MAPHKPKNDDDTTQRQAAMQQQSAMHRQETLYQRADHNDEQPLSKTAIKKEMLALQALGESLVKLSKGELASIAIADATLAEAIDTARRIKHREGLRRQMQYIGKLMRKTDIQPIADAYQALLEGRKAQTRQFHLMEQWRDELIAQGPSASEQVMAKYPHADRQHLRQLIKQAIKEQANNKPPASARKLFRYLRELATVNN